MMSCIAPTGEEKAELVQQGARGRVSAQQFAFLLRLRSKSLTRKKTLSISGMSCISCQNKIEKALRKKKGIESVSVRYETGTAEIEYEDKKISLKEIERIIQDAGYSTGGSANSVARTASILILIFALFVILQRSGILNTLAPSQLADSRMSYGMLFLIGLLTSVHCVAMCGGINISNCIGHTEQTLRPALWYNLGRVLSYTGIGFVLGLIGSLAGNANVGIPVVFQGALKIIAGILMILMGVNMLNLFPGLRRFTPPFMKKLALRVQSQKAGSSAFVVGLLNGFMPCGPLQSMQIVALAAGSPVVGAISMLMFSLGTVPLMLGLGSAVSMLGRRFAGKVMTAGSVLVVVLGLAMLSQGSSLAGFPYMLTQQDVISENAAAGTESGTKVQEVHSTLTGGRYPDITVTAGIPVKWVIDVPKDALNGCNYRMLLSAYGIEHTFTEGENIIEFTPTATGDIPYTCWMGMIRGDIYVTE